LKGHGFSRAESGITLAGALAPEGSSSENSPSHWTSSGWDEVEYKIATNPGEPLKALHEIASGGEMSRVMLALKVSVEEGAVKPKRKTPTPELWSSMRSILALAACRGAVGQKLKSLSRGQQVLCVPTCRRSPRLPISTLSLKSARLTAAPKCRSGCWTIARACMRWRMVSGAKVTETSLQHAAQMIAGSR